MIPLNKRNKIEVDLLWLRDNCRCKDCYDETTSQRKLKFTEIPEDVGISGAEYLDNTVYIKCESDQQKIYQQFTHLILSGTDNHWSKYSNSFLQTYNFPHYQLIGDQEQPIFWNLNKIKDAPARVDYREYLCDDEVSKKLVKSLLNYGVAFIDKVPVNAQQTEFVVRKLFPIQKTAFGETRLYVEKNEESAAFGPHTENTYFSDPPGLCVLHCLSYEDCDGAISLIDGFNVSENLKERSPDTFSRLCTTMVSYEYTEDGKHYKHTDPIIKTDPITKRIEQIRYNLYNRAPIDRLPMNLIRQYYKDLTELTEEIEKPNNRWTFDLNPGTVMILDNWRVLYCNNDVGGRKNMVGCYVMRTEYLSVARTMELVR